MQQNNCTQRVLLSIHNPVMEPTTRGHSSSLGPGILQKGTKMQNVYKCTEGLVGTVQSVKLMFIFIFFFFFH
jgi:hypothetical protein